MPIVERETGYHPFPRQQEFHRSAAKYRLFGGAAGPGKSTALLWEAIEQANQFAGVDTLLLRRTFPELESSLIERFKRDVPREMYESYNSSKHIVKWLNGSTTRFGQCASEDDVYQYQGAEYLFIGLDEMTHFTLKQWQFLTSRNRCPVPGTFPNMAGASNPGNVGHVWVKALFIDKEAPSDYESPEQYDPDEYEFIPATLADNPVYAHDAAYHKTLEKLPKPLRDAMLYGLWEQFIGQYFDAQALVPGWTVPQQSVNLLRWYPRWVSIDWGFEHPSAVYWHCALPGGNVVTYREFVQNHLSPRMLAAAVLEKSEGETISAVYLSPDAYAKRTQEDTIAEQITKAFAVEDKLPAPEPADDDRVGGWMLMYELFRTGQLQVTDGCQKLVKLLPTLIRDPKKPEDILKMDGDDPADSARYGIKSHLSPGKMPKADALAEKVKDLSPTSRAIWMRKAEEKSAVRVNPISGRRWRPGMRV